MGIGGERRDGRGAASRFLGKALVACRPGRRSAESPDRSGAQSRKTSGIHTSSISSRWILAEFFGVGGGGKGRIFGEKSGASDNYTGFAEVLHKVAPVAHRRNPELAQRSNPVRHE